jgi:hypothetical protein
VPASQPAGRTITLVVAVDGTVVGALSPFNVDTPYWQDMEPVARRFPELDVLRLLDVRSMPGALGGGDVTYLAEPRSRDALDGVALSPWPGVLEDDALRMPWAMPGGPALDTGWAAAHLDAPGRPFQHRTWNLSAIWSIPTRTSRAWLKCIPAFFRHEPAVLEVLSGHRVPRLLATDRHRLLLDELPGIDGYAATLAERRALVTQLVGLQHWSIERVDDLLARGVPDRRWPALIEASRALGERLAPGDAGLWRLLDSAGDRVAAIDRCGLPDVLVHGDAHPGNARIGEGAGIWFDWGDARIGHPLCDVAVLDRPRTTHADELTRYWLDRWAAAVPGSDPHRAWPLVRPLAALGSALVYQGFLDGIERSERIYHEGDVAPCLRQAVAYAEQAPIGRRTS